MSYLPADIKCCLKDSRNPRSQQSLCVGAGSGLATDVQRLSWHTALMFGFSKFPLSVWSRSLGLGAELVWIFWLCHRAAAPAAFFGSGPALPNQPVWEHDPWSRKTPQAPLQQNPSAPFSHCCLFIMALLFSPLVSAYWNATLRVPHLNLCELNSHLSSTQVQRYDFRFVKYSNIFFLFNSIYSLKAEEVLRWDKKKCWKIVCTFSPPKIISHFSRFSLLYYFNFVAIFWNNSY